jgi:hypothetical protein
MSTVQVNDNGSIKRCRDALGRFSKNISGASPEIEMELQRAWNKVKVDAVTICPKDTGSLASTIKIVATEQVDSLFGSPNKSITLFDRAIIAGDETKINPKTKGPVNYALPVHDGYMRRDGAIYLGTPFLSYALANNEDALEAAIDRALMKLGKKFETDGGSD